MSGARQHRPRSEAAYGPETGTTYLLHFDRPYGPGGGANGRGTARHYTGWTKDLAARLEEHRRGQGSRLMQVVRAAGISFTLARTWDGTTRDREDSLKHQGSASRFCPECGVKPAAPRLGTDRQAAPAPRLSLYDLERQGTDLDGNPLPDITKYPAAAQATARKENQMLGRERRAAARQWAQQQAEADRLLALADQLAAQAGERPDYQRDITAERAARLRELLGEDLVRDARSQAQASEHVLQGDELAAEIDRLAGQFGEPEPLFGPRPDGTYADAIGAEEAEAQRQPAAPEMGQDYYTQPVGSDRHRAAYREYMDATGGPRDGWTTEQEYAADHHADLEYDRLQDALDRAAAAQEPPPDPGPHEAGAAEPDQDYPPTRERSREDADADPYLAGGFAVPSDVVAEPGPDHLYGAPECAEADPESAHFGPTSPEAQDAGRWPLPRVLEPAEVSPLSAPVAAALPDGTPHADPYLAERGWQAQGGVYARQPQAQLEAG